VKEKRILAADRALRRDFLEELQATLEGL